MKPLPQFVWLSGLALVACVWGSGEIARAEGPSADASPARIYANTLRVIDNPQPLLADYPEFIEPIVEERRYEAPVLVSDAGANLDVRAWRFSYNARGIIEMPNRLRAANTAVIVVHPWGIDDGQGWRTPEPAGVADFCTPNKNHLAGRHTREVIDPFLKRLREQVGVVLYSLRSKEYPVHTKLYRSIRHNPTPAEREEGRRELARSLNEFEYRGQSLPEKLELSADQPVKDYFRQFPGLAFGPEYNNAGFWDMAIPVTSDITMHPNDVVFYDDDGYPALRDFLKQNKIHHILLTGYATDMCYCLTTAGYKNLSADFNVFLVGDASLATFPANSTPRFATNAHISFAALNQLVTQCSWVKLDTEDQTADARLPVHPKPTAR